MLVVEVAERTASGTGGEAQAADAEEKVPLPESWFASVYTRNVAHTQTAEHVRLWGRGLGLLAVALSTITGTTLFTTLQDSPSQGTRAFIGALAAVAALVTAFNTFFAFGQQEADHRKAASGYETLKHELQELDALGGTTTRAALDDFRTRWDKLNADAPTLPRGAWSRADRYVGERLDGRARRPRGRRLFE